MLLQLPCSAAGAFWFFYQRNFHFSRLMGRYSSFLSAVDVARGRAVPVPPDQRRVHTLVPPSNPYSASPDTRLLLDLLATLQGPGPALRVLAVLEPDIATSWQVSGLTLQFQAESLTVYWKDPLVLGKDTTPKGYSF